MAKALIAAVLLAAVLVAAVVVPLVLLPDASGFDQWPKATPHPAHAEVVSVDVPSREAVRIPRQQRDPAPRAVAPQEQLAQAAPAPTAVRGTKQNTPSQPVPVEQPQAAPEAPLPPPVVDARDHTGSTPDAISGQVQTDLELDGTNAP
jgi:hypothetical protein